MLDAFFRLFSLQGYSPHGFCLLWQPWLLRLQAISDALIAAAYFSIPLALAYFLMRRRDLAAGWIVWLFAAFILACGTTHWLEIATLYYPLYLLQGVIKAIAAAISVVTAIALWPLVIRALAIPTPEALRVATETAARTEQERDQALSLLRQTEETFRTILDSLSDHAIFMLNRNGRVTTWNRGAQRLKGYATEDILGRHFSVFYTEEEREAGWPAAVLREVDETGRYEGEGWRVRSDGSRFWASIVIERVLDAAGQPIGYVKVTRDITERRQAALALEQTRAALLQAQKMETVGQLAGGIAHDFNNLLTAILGSANLLERRLEGAAGETITRPLAAIAQAGERGAALTQQLLAFSRKQALRPQATDVGLLIRGTTELLTRTLGEDILIQTDLQPGLNPVLVDQNQLSATLLNLAVNARDAMPRGGTLTIRTNLAESGELPPDLPPGDYLRLTVTDTGDGMAPEVLEHAFEPFFTTKPVGKGTGLGLSQAFGFVKQSGGHIVLDSTPGQGTRATLYLPMQTGLAAVSPPESGVMGAPPRGHETVLVVEDDPGVRAYVASALRDLGYRVEEASEAVSALASAETSPPDLVVTDIGLPGMSGPDLARILASRGPVRILMMSAYDTEALRKHGVGGQAAPVLTKPFTIAALADAVRAVLDTAVPDAPAFV